MMKCRQCQRALHAETDVAAAAAAAGPVLGESYVLLPTATSPRAAQQAASMLLMEESAMSFMGDAFGGNSSARPGATGDEYDYFASNNNSNGPVMSEQRVQEQYFSTDARPAPAATPTKSADPSPRSTHSRRYSAAVSAHAYRDKPSSLGDSMSAVVAHADLSHQVQLITTHHAHCAGVPVTTPVCKECVDSMIQQIDRQAERARYDKRCFTGFLHSTGSSVRNEEVEQVHERIRYYEEELAALEENLALMETERSEIHARQASLRADATALAQEEALVWHELNEMLYCDETFRDLRDVARAQIARSEQQNAAVQQTSILTDLFVISHSGPFATINGFRVGQLAAVPVEWNEINAGLGEAALLLQTLANAIGLEFADFKLVPLGSFSKIVRFTNLRMEYALHGSDQDNFPESHFNLGLGAWITCLRQLIAAVEATDKTMRVPYKISKHAINNHSVLFLKNRQSEWTKALKYALTNLKWLLTWTTTRSTRALDSVV